MKHQIVDQSNEVDADIGQCPMKNLSKDIVAFFVHTLQSRVEQLHLLLQTVVIVFFGDVDRDTQGSVHNSCYGRHNKPLTICTVFTGEHTQQKDGQSDGGGSECEHCFAKAMVFWIWKRGKVCPIGHRVGRQIIRLVMRNGRLEHDDMVVLKRDPNVGIESQYNSKLNGKQERHHLIGEQCCSTCRKPFFTIIFHFFPEKKVKMIRNLLFVWELTKATLSMLIFTPPAPPKEEEEEPNPV